VAVSIADIAERAGVSASTVSYALSGKKPVSAELRRRVMQAVQELGYRPHAAARALASRRSHTIALHVPPLSRGLVATQLEFVSAIAEETSRHGYDLLLSVSGDEQETITRLVQEGVVDGLILMEVRLEDPRVQLLRGFGTPFVLVGRPADSSGLRYVDADTDAMVRRAMTYLHGLGHREIAFVNLPEALLEAGYAPAVRALDAYRVACSSLGIRAVAVSCGTSVDATQSCVEELLADRPGVSALLSNNDDALAGLMAALPVAGRRVPEDVSVFGILGATRAGQLTRPRLTAIELPTVAMGVAAARILIAGLEDPGSVSSAGTLFDPIITEGGSCASLA
jgi:DNA-binding LacI/PurR family transcriptional regulator